MTSNISNKILLSVITIFLLALFTSMAAVQLIAIAMIIYSLSFGNDCLSANKFLWRIAFFYVASLFIISYLNGDIESALLSLRRTWMILIAPVAANISSKLEEKHRRYLESFFIYASAIFAVIFLFQKAIGDPAISGRYAFHRAPYVASFILIPAMLFILIKEKILFTHAIIALIIAAAMTLINSRGPIIALFASAITALVFSSFDKKILKRIVILIIAISILVGICIGFDRWNFFDLSKQTSIVYRMVIWNQVIEEIKEKPLLGHGFDNFETDNQKTITVFREFATNETNPHNSYLMILHSSGIIGYSILWFVLGAALWMLKKSFLKNQNKWSIVSFSMLIGMMIAALADKTFFVTQICLEAWFLVGIGISEEKEDLA